MSNASADLHDDLTPDEAVAEGTGLSTARRKSFSFANNSPTAEADKRIKEGRPLDAQRVIPSAAPMPLDAQRDFRGWIVLAILGLIFLGIVLTIILVKKVASRTIVYAPTAERVGAVTTAREATTFEMRQQAQWLLLRMESWTPANVSTVWEEMVPYLHPQLHERVRKDYEQLAAHAEQLWQSRIALPLGVALSDAQAGTRAAAIFYDQVELTGRTENERKLTAVVPKAAYIQFVYETPTKENPIGLLVTHYQTYDKESWLKNGFPDMWDAFRKKKPPEKKK